MPFYRWPWTIVILHHFCQLWPSVDERRKKPCANVSTANIWIGKTRIVMVTTGACIMGITKIREGPASVGRKSSNAGMSVRQRKLPCRNKAKGWWLFSVVIQSFQWWRERRLIVVRPAVRSDLSLRPFNFLRLGISLLHPKRYSKTFSLSGRYYSYTTPYFFFAMKTREGRYEY